MKTRFSPYFDRFDICEAFFAFYAECHSGQSSEVYAIGGRLHDLQFSPGMGGASWDRFMDELECGNGTNKAEIYCNAWLHYYPGEPLPEDCQEWVRENYIPEFITELETAGALNK